MGDFGLCSKDSWKGRIAGENQNIRTSDGDYRWLSGVEATGNRHPTHPD